MNVYESIFQQLDKLGIIEMIRQNREHAKSESEPCMPFSYDLLFRDPASGICEIALAHNYVQNGDLCCDPDMRVRVDLKHGMAEALSYQTSIPPVYQEVYAEPGQFNPRLKIQLNRFLHQWLTNCIEQGHGFSSEAA